MQDQIRIIEVNELKLASAIVKSLAAILAESIKDDIAKGIYVVVDGVVQKAEKLA